MNELTVTGKQNFMEIEIPVVAGGFGKDKRCMSDKTIAAIHGMEAVMEESPNGKGGNQ